ncbi:MAG: hypothetical protein ABJB97_10315 [Acidobacteriota bacterium]
MLAEATGVSKSLANRAGDSLRRELIDTPYRGGGISRVASLAHGHRFGARQNVRGVTFRMLK